ncbi:MAG: MarR family winged helix-turn-helix transcriptional regulator [Lachnospirales bacterium]
MEDYANEDIRHLQEELLALMPVWNYRIAKPFKQMLDEGVSLEMYYCIQTLRWYGGTLTMSELARYVRMPKHQMTKMADRLIAHEFVKRVYDVDDRRVIRLQITEKALAYIDHFLDEDAGCFRKLFENMTEENRVRFQEAMKAMIDILIELPQA